MTKTNKATILELYPRLKTQYATAIAKHIRKTKEFIKSRPKHHKNHGRPEENWLYTYQKE